MRSIASTSGSAFSDPVLNAVAIAPKVCRVEVLCGFYIKCDDASTGLTFSFVMSSASSIFPSL